LSRKEPSFNITSLTGQSCDLNIRRTASAFSAAEIGNSAIIARAAANGFGIVVSGDLVQRVVQPSKADDVTSCWSTLGTLERHVRDVEVAGSNPVTPTFS
jgi:hypothetical protein